jgi:hypothetical protein
LKQLVPDVARFEVGKHQHVCWLVEIGELVRPLKNLVDNSRICLHLSINGEVNLVVIVK